MRIMDSGGRDRTVQTTVSLPPADMRAPKPVVGCGKRARRRNAAFCTAAIITALVFVCVVVLTTTELVPTTASTATNDEISKQSTVFKMVSEEKKGKTLFATSAVNRREENEDVRNNVNIPIEDWDLPQTALSSLPPLESLSTDRVATSATAFSSSLVSSSLPHSTQGKDESTMTHHHIITTTTNTTTAHHVQPPLVHAFDNETATVHPNPSLSSRHRTVQHHHHHHGAAALHMCNRVENSLAWTAAWLMYYSNKAKPFTTAANMAGFYPANAAVADAGSKSGTRSPLSTDVHSFFQGRLYENDASFLSDMFALETRYNQMTLAEAKARAITTTTTAKTIGETEGPSGEHDDGGRNKNIEETLQSRRDKLELFLARVQQPTPTVSPFFFKSKDNANETATATHEGPLFHSIKVRDAFPTHLAFIDKRWFWEELFGVSGAENVDSAADHEKSTSFLHRPQREAYFDGFAGRMAKKGHSAPMVKVPGGELLNLSALEPPRYLWHGWKTARDDEKEVEKKEGRARSKEQRETERVGSTGTNKTAAQPPFPFSATATPPLLSLTSSLNYNLMSRVLPVECRVTEFEKKAAVERDDHSSQIYHNNGVGGGGEDDEKRKHQSSSRDETKSRVKLHHTSPPCSPTATLEITVADDTDRTNAVPSGGDVDDYERHFHTNVEQAARLVKKQMFAPRCQRVNIHNGTVFRVDKATSEKAPTQTVVVPQVVLDLAMPSVQIAMRPRDQNPLSPHPNAAASAQPTTRKSISLSQATLVTHQHCEAICRRMEFFFVDVVTVDDKFAPPPNSKAATRAWSCAGYRASFLGKDDAMNAFISNSKDAQTEESVEPKEESINNNGNRDGKGRRLVCANEEEVGGGAADVRPPPLDAEANIVIPYEAAIGDGRADGNEEDAPQKQQQAANTSVTATAKPAKTHQSKLTVDQRKRCRWVDVSSSLAPSTTPTAAEKQQTPAASVVIVGVCEFFSVNSINTMGWLGGLTSSGVTLVRSRASAAFSPSATLTIDVNANNNNRNNIHTTTPPPLLLLEEKLTRMAPLPFESSVNYHLRSNSEVDVRHKREEPSQQLSSFSPPSALLTSPIRRTRTLFSLQHHHRLRRLVAFGSLTNERYLEERVIPMLDTWLRRWDAYLVFEDYFNHRLVAEKDEEGKGGTNKVNYQYRNLDKHGKPLAVPENSVSQYMGDDMKSFLHVPAIVETEEKVNNSEGSAAGDVLRFPSPSGHIHPRNRKDKFKEEKAFNDKEKKKRLMPNYMASERLDVAARIRIDHSSSFSFSSPRDYYLSPLQKLMRYFVWLSLNEVFGFGDESMWMNEPPLPAAAAAPARAAAEISSYRQLILNMGLGKDEKEEKGHNLQPPLKPFSGEDDDVFAAKSSHNPFRDAVIQQEQEKAAAKTQAAGHYSDPRKYIIRAFFAKMCRMQRRAREQQQGGEGQQGSSNDDGGCGEEAATLKRKARDDEAAGARLGERNDLKNNDQNPTIKNQEPSSQSDFVRRGHLPDESSGRLVVPGTKIMMREQRALNARKRKGKGGGGRETRTSADLDDFSCGSDGLQPCTMPLGFVRPLFVAEPRNFNNTAVHGRGGAWKNYPLLVLMLRADTVDEGLKQKQLHRLLEARRKGGREGMTKNNHTGDVSKQSSSSQMTSQSALHLLTPREQLYFTRRQFYVIVDDDSYFVRRNLVIFLTYFVPARTFGGGNFGFFSATPTSEQRQQSSSLEDGDGQEARHEGRNKQRHHRPLSLQRRYDAFAENLLLSKDHKGMPFYTGDVHQRLKDPLNAYRIVHGGAGAFFNREALLRVTRGAIEGGIGNDDGIVGDGNDKHHDEASTGKEEKASRASLIPPSSSFPFAKGPPGSKLLVGIDGSLVNDLFGEGVEGADENDDEVARRQFYNQQLWNAMYEGYAKHNDGNEGYSPIESAPLPQEAPAVAAAGLLIQKGASPAFLNLSDSVCAHPRHQHVTIFGDVWLGICATRIAHVEPIPNALFCYMTPFTGYWIGEKYKKRAVRGTDSHHTSTTTQSSSSSMGGGGGGGEGSGKFPLSFHNIRNEKMFYALHQRELVFERQLISVAHTRSFVCEPSRGEGEEGGDENNSRDNGKFKPQSMWHAGQRKCYTKALKDEEDEQHRRRGEERQKRGETSEKGVGNASATTSPPPSLFYEAHLPSSYVAHIPFPWSRVASFPRNKNDISSFIFKRYADFYRFKFDPEVPHEVQKSFFFFKMNGKAEFNQFAHKMLALATV